MLQVINLPSQACCEKSEKKGNSLSARHIRAPFHSLLRVTISIFHFVFLSNCSLWLFVDLCLAFDHTIDTYGICVLHRTNSTKERLLFPICLAHFSTALFRPGFNIL